MDKAVLASVVFISFVLQGCSEQSDIRQLSSNHDLSAETAAIRKKSTAMLQQILYQQESALAKYKGDVQRYMMQHKMAVASIAGTAGGGAIALDPDNEFTEDAQALAGVVGVVAGLYAISNFDEVQEVADQMIQADAHVKNLESQIAATKLRISAEMSSIKK